MMLNELIARLRVKHHEMFGTDPKWIAYAPGRVEILGNHTDYNEGYVLSAAIDAGLAVGLTPAEGDTCTLLAADLDERVQFQAIEPGRTDVERWSNYPRGVLTFLAEKYALRPRAFNGTLAGDIPIAAGLSSSAALEIASGLAFSALHRISPEKIELAKIAQKAEHEFAGVRCGLLDQISSLFGRKQSLVFTDFRSLDVDSVSLSPDVAFMIADTHIQHTLVDSEYNERRQRCEQAATAFARILGPRVTALRDVTWDDMLQYRGRIDPAVWKRAAHPVGENERVLAGVAALKNGETIEFGRLMFASHESSQKYFENSHPELDVLVDAARRIPGVIGARLSGGGFGGSVVALIEKDRAPLVAQFLARAYEDAFGRRIEPRVVVPSDGARMIA